VGKLRNSSRFIGFGYFKQLLQMITQGKSILSIWEKDNSQGWYEVTLTKPIVQDPYQLGQFQL
jgi:hypothetical protein